MRKRCCSHTCLKKRQARNKGFTLVELVMVATIFAIIAAGIAGAFVSGIKMWDAARRFNNFNIDLFLVTEKMAHELRETVETGHCKPSGTKDQISFPIVNGDSVIKVSYVFDSAGNLLVRREVDIKDVIADNETESAKDKEMLAMEELSFSYLKKDGEKIDWKDSWSEEDGMFLAVRLHGRLGNEEFTKTIFRPAS